MRGRRAPAHAGLCVLVLAAAAAGAGAQATPLEDELRELNRSVARLVVLLEQLVAHERTSLTLRRMELKVQRLAPLEAEQRASTTRREEQRLAIEAFEQQIETLRSQSFEAENKPLGDDGVSQSQALRDTIQQQEVYLEQQRRSLATLDGHLAELESTIARLTAELGGLERDLLP